MTMLIEFRGDCFVDPAKWCRLDLDSERDRETFRNIDFMMAAEHLYPEWIEAWEYHPNVEKYYWSTASARCGSGQRESISSSSSSTSSRRGTKNLNPKHIYTMGET